MILPEILPGFFQDFKFLPGFLRDPFRVFFFVFVLQDPFLQDSTGLSVIPVGSSSTPWIVSGSFHNAVHLPCTVNGFLQDSLCYHCTAKDLLAEENGFGLRMNLRAASG